ncbi:chorismate mutase [Embleya sp. NPDC056575]|uniref:chorismate mutase n=1 Tax=unclassified Embleya TaxID=2699296 RepID=UPI0036967957
MDDTTTTPPQAPEDVIGVGRARIDDLDRRIIALITERVDISAEIQRVRVASGGARVQLSREMEVIARYREGLGKPGTTVALTLLELCRGRVGPRA